MINEKLIELLVLESLIEQANSNYKIVSFNNKDYDNKKIHLRFNELLEEFLEPYVIESDSKEN